MLIRNHSHRGPRILSVLALASSLLCGLARAQSVPQGGVLHVDSRLISLDVTVLDKNGNLVNNLNRDDFRIYESGERQAIHDFEDFNEHQLPPKLTVDSIDNTADLQRVAPDAPVTVLVLDEFNTDFSDTAFARMSIRRYLLAQPQLLSQPTSFVAATDEGFQQVVDYTLDRAKLLSGLQRLPAVLPGVLMRTGGSAEGRALRFAQTLMSLQHIAQAGAGHPGRKNIVWVGRGFDSIDLTNATDLQVRVVKGAAERAINILRDSHASVYTIDPTLSTKLLGETNPEETTSDPDAFIAETHSSADPFDGTVSFNTIAPETGGRSFAVYNNVDAEIGTSIAEGNSYYTLTYIPNGPVDSLHPYRGITVTVSRPGLVVVTRKGYYSSTPPPPARTAAQDLKAQGFDIGSALNSGIVYTGLGVKATLSPSDPAKCVVQVNTRDIDWQPQPDGGLSAHLTLVAVAVDAKGFLIGKIAKDIVAKLGTEKDLADLPNTTLHINLPSAPKAVAERIAVRDAASGKMGTSELRLPAR
jgi:VWFA-related protein